MSIERLFKTLIGVQVDKALIIGIDQYDGAPLNGCVNDALKIVDFLISSDLKFPPESIRLLLDKQATGHSMLESFEWAVSDLSINDRLFIHFSGHGAQVATRNLELELDGLDEVLCSCDFDWQNGTMVRDKQLYQLFARIPFGVKAIFVSDSCHSGDLTRGVMNLGGRNARVYPLTVKGMALVREANLKGFEIDETPYPNIVLVSGSQSDQTSAEAIIDGKPAGALTHFLLKALNNPHGLETPLIKLIDQVRYLLRSNSFSQNPQLEGPDYLINGPFFGIDR